MLRHDLTVDEYTWPARSDALAESYKEVWAATVAALPLGTSMAGEVLGRRRFGVFIRVDGVPGAVALAEITAMPQGMDLPVLGDRVVGEVIGHAEHNHQVRVRLQAWRTSVE